MKTYLCLRGSLPETIPPLSCSIAAIGALLVSAGAMAMPRPALPPWPETGMLYQESFDQPCEPSAGQWIDPSVWAESWSGYALNRSSAQAVVTPWVVPMTATNGAWNIAPASGALRVWYQPDAGAGSGSPATLLTLVSSGSRGGSAVWWSLVVSADGQSLALTCEGASGSSTCLSAPVALATGVWSLVTLQYSETNSVLFINDQEAATGAGLPTVPAELGPVTSLVLGSRLSGDLVACGQLEEFAAFTRQRRYRHEPVFDASNSVAQYYGAYSELAALGLTSEAELAAQRQARTQRRATLAAAAGRQARMSPLDAGGPLALLDASACATGGRVYMTNVVYALDTNLGWTASLTIAGSTNGVPWDIFRVEAIGVGSVTNWSWVWLGQGYTCNTYTFTNQPDGQALYMLGDAFDPDGDSLGTAFELLVSHSDPVQWSTRGDGIDDGTAYFQGRNPRVPGSLPDTNGVINLQVYTPLK